MDTETFSRKISLTNLPLNYTIAQQESAASKSNQDGTSQPSNPVSRSPSQSLLLSQLSSSPYGWAGSRSTSPTPPILSSSLRRVPSGSSSRFMTQGTHQSLQALVKSFINKVSRATQTDCDDNFDQVSIASLQSGLSGIESDRLTRSRLKLFLNDSISNDNKINTNSAIDENEFVEELQKLRDQIDGRFKIGGFSFEPESRATSRPVSQPITPKDFDDGMVSLDLDRNLEDFGHVSATKDSSIQTERLTYENQATQVDILMENSNQDRGFSSIFQFPFLKSSSVSPQESESISFNVAVQTEFNLDDLCECCRDKMDCFEREGSLLKADSIRFISGAKQPILKCEFMISPSDLVAKSQKNVFTFDDVDVQQHQSLEKMESKSNTGVQADMPGSNSISTLVSQPTSVKKNASIVGTQNSTTLANNNKPSLLLANGELRNKKSKKTNKSKSMRIIADENDVSHKMDHVKPKCCAIS